MPDNDSSPAVPDVQEGLCLPRMANGPDLWQAILAQMPEGAIVAGGAVRDFLLGYEPKDIDVFMGLPPVAEYAPDEPLGDMLDAISAHDPRHGLMRIENTHERYEEYAAVSNIVCVSSGALFGYRVDAIDIGDFDGGEKLIEQFDFGITRCWFDGKLHDTPEAKIDRDTRTMTLLLSERRQRSIARFDRLRERWGADWKLRDATPSPDTSNA